MARVAASIVLASTVAFAQTQTVKFEVVSVKRNVSGDRGGSFGFQPGGRFVATNMPALSFVVSAYEIQRFQLVGAPDWLETERYDVNAVAPGATFRQQPELLRALLAERFKLTTHSETRMLTGHALVRDRADGKLGPQLKPVTVDCDALRASGTLAGERPRLTMQDFLTPRLCSSYGGIGMFVTGNISMDGLARELIRSANVPVRNETGLAGEFEVVLRWNPDPLSAGVDPTLPSSLPIALREQLGLRLESRQQSVDVVVIDRIERPTEN